MTLKHACMYGLIKHACMYGLIKHACMQAQARAACGGGVCAQHQQQLSVLCRHSLQSQAAVRTAVAAAAMVACCVQCLEGTAPG